MRQQSIYETGIRVREGDLMIANITDFAITKGRIYVAKSNQGDATFHECVYIIDDNGAPDEYSVEYFNKYEGELVNGYL